MKDNIIVSISCTTYNHEKYIQQAFDSFLNQITTFKFEVLINDDASTDGTKKIIEEYSYKYPDIFFPLYQKENQYSKGLRGMFLRFNLPRCRGKYIAICEGDDYWTDPYKLQKQVDFLDSNIEFAISFHKVSVLNMIDKTQNKVSNQNQELISNISDLALNGNFIHTLSVVFRNQNVYPDWLKDCIVGDYPLHLFNAQFGKIKFFDEIMGVYRIHESGIWGPFSQEKIHDRWISVLDFLENKFSPEVNRLLIIQKKRMLFEMYKIAFELKNSNKAFDIMMKLSSIDSFYLAKRLQGVEKRMEGILNSKSYRIGNTFVNFFFTPFRIFNKIKK